MIPAARYAAAIDILERIIDSEPAEKVLTVWARNNRYAGSKDRAAIRDIIFDCLRNLRSYQHESGLSDARGTIAGLLKSNGIDLSLVFSGVGYAPVELSDYEIETIASVKDGPSQGVTLNIQDWMLDLLDEDGAQEIPYLSERAPIDLRVNLKKANLDKVQTLLSQDGVETKTVSGVASALRVVGQTRKIPHLDLYMNGQIELQDAGSQMLISRIDFPDQGTVLDYCAGGGGKSLAIAALEKELEITAFDISSKRMMDIPERAKRAGAKIKVSNHDPVGSAASFDVLVLDVPCSGSGSWRRSPDAKWKLTPDRLAELCAMQTDILAKTHQLVHKGGIIAYMTCSLFREENENQIDVFLQENPNWSIRSQSRIKLSDGCDGFFICILEN